MTMGSLILTVWERSPGAGGELEQSNDFVLFGEQNRGLRGWDVEGSGRARSELRSEVSSDHSGLCKSRLESQGREEAWRALGGRLPGCESGFQKVTFCVVSAPWMRPCETVSPVRERRMWLQ